MSEEMPGPDISVRLGRLSLKNPVMTASGTFGYGREYSRFLDLNQVGGIIVKGTSLMPRLGNPPLRIAEVVGGTLSSVGLHNVGVERFIKEKLPYLRELDSRIIVNIFGASVSDYREVAKRLEGTDGVAGIEVNISCPNVKEGGVAFGSYPDQTFKVVKSVRDATTLPLMVKLSPNVTDITVIARAAAEAGAEILSLINNPTGLAIDINSRKPMLANVTGGLAGPAIKPIALRMVWEVYKAGLGLPLVGIGGIASSKDAIEFIIAGASAIQVGSANFIDPRVSLKIISGIKQHCSNNGIENIADLVGTLNV